MPIDPTHAIQAVERSVSSIPAAIVVIVLLAGPTILWLLYRFVVQPRNSRFGADVADLLWVCADCRSVNEARVSHCYRCGLAQTAITGPLQVFDGDGLVTLEGDEDEWDEWEDEGAIEPAAVGEAQAATSLGMRPDDAPTPVPLPPVAVPIAPRRLVAVGPGNGRRRATTPAADEAPGGGVPTGGVPSSTTPAPEPMRPEPQPEPEAAPAPVAVPIGRAPKRTRGPVSSRRGSSAPAADPVDPIVEA